MAHDQGFHNSPKHGTCGYCNFSLINTPNSAQITRSDRASI